MGPETTVETEGKSKGSQEGKEEISGAEILVGALLIGMKVKHFFDNKGSEIGKVFDEAKEDFKTQPTTYKEIIGRSILSFGSLVLEHEREQKEQRLEIKQKFLDSMHNIAAQQNQLEILDDYEKLQREAIVETAKSPRKRIGMSEEEKTKTRASIDMAGKTRNEEAKKQVEDFISGLLKLLK